MEVPLDIKGRLHTPSSLCFCKKKNRKIKTKPSKLTAFPSNQPPNALEHQAESREHPLTQQIQSN